MTSRRRWDLRPFIGLTFCAVVWLLVGKIDGITCAAFIFIGFCGTLGVTYRKRWLDEDNDRHVSKGS